MNPAQRVGWHHWRFAFSSEPRGGDQPPEAVGLAAHPFPSCDPCRGSAQPFGERGFPYPSVQHSQEVSSPPGSREAKANPCRLPASFSHDQRCRAPGIPPPQRKSKSHSDTTETFFLFDHFTGNQQNATATSPVSFPLQSSSSSPDQGQPFLGCWTALICREAKVELALGGCNNNETFWALQSTGLGVIKEEERRHCRAQVSKGKV